jgi:mRNA-degrading endonuclease RelE of RelBE toxin-antitoxin system
MPRRVVFGPDAVRQFRRLRAHDQAMLRSAMRTQLEEAGATHETRNRFRLRRPSAVAEYELRVEAWRVFYRVAGDDVQVALIGRKRGNVLLIEGQRFVL